MVPSLRLRRLSLSLSLSCLACWWQRGKICNKPEQNEEVQHAPSHRNIPPRNCRRDQSVEGRCPAVRPSGFPSYRMMFPSAASRSIWRSCLSLSKSRPQPYFSRSLRKSNRKTVVPVLSLDHFPSQKASIKPPEYSSMSSLTSFSRSPAAATHLSTIRDVCVLLPVNSTQQRCTNVHSARMLALRSRPV